MFALSATATDSQDTFQKMKDAVVSVVEIFGVDQPQYGVILYGSSATVSIDFSREFPSPKALQSRLALYPRERGSPDLTKALKEVNNLFENSEARSGVPKVLVILTDKGSGIPDVDLLKALSPLKEKDVRVIPVALGEKVEEEEMETIADTKDDAIKKPISVGAKELSNAIVKKILEGSQFHEFQVSNSAIIKVNRGF